MNKKLDQKGAVAILTVVIFATIITVLITAYLASSVTQTSEAQTYDFSTRAFYAAESGIQDTVREIKASGNIQDKTDCTPRPPNISGVIGTSIDFGLSYSCQLIHVNPSSLTGTVIPGEQSAMAQLIPSSGASPKKIVIRWSTQQPQDPNDPINSVITPRFTNKKTFTPNNSWISGNGVGNPVHALLRVSVIDHPKGTFSRDGADRISQRVVFLNPSSVSYKDADVDFKKSSNNVSQQQKEFINNAECYDSNSTPPPASNMGDFRCKQAIDISDYNFNSSSVYVRVGSVYRTTDFDIQLLDASSNPIPLSGGQINIDITGKAGVNTYRRIKQNFSLGGFQLQYGPDAALVAGEGICKQIVLTTNYNSFRSLCNPLATP